MSHVREPEEALRPGGRCRPTGTLVAALVLALTGAMAAPASAKDCDPAHPCPPATQSTPRSAHAAGQPVSRSSTGVRTSPTMKTNAPRGEAAPPGELGFDRLVAWVWIGVATLLAMAAATYPIVFYVRQVWSFRQRTIFDTLSPTAKSIYLELFHRSELGTDTSVATDPTEAFAAAYARWFGRSRLVVPAVIIAAFILVYALLVAIAAAKWLMPDAMRDVVSAPLLACSAMTGAYILVTLDTIERITRRDLLPDDLYLSALRLASCVPLGIAFASLAAVEVRPFVALAMTAFPLSETAAFLRKVAAQKAGLELSTPATFNDAPSRLSGVDRAICERLSAIGVNTIAQLAYCDPVQLTMRTSLGFVFALDLVSQALAWMYLEEKLAALRPMGLRGSFEIAALRSEASGSNPKLLANAQTVLAQLPQTLGLTPEQTANVVHQIADDPYTRFLLIAYS